MRRLILAVAITIFLLLFLTDAASGGRQPSVREPSLANVPPLDTPLTIRTNIDSIMVAHMAAEEIPGCAFAVFCSTGIYYTGTYGYAQLEDSIPVTEHTAFCVASVSKAVTGTVMMKLWEDGAFSLDDDVNIYTDFSIIHPTCPDSAVTIRKVMTHTSSIPSSIFVSVPPDAPLCTVLADYLDPDGPDYSEAYWPDPCPGTTYEYAGAGAILLGCLIGTISGSTCIDYSRSQVFEPLGMFDSSWTGDELDPLQVAYSYSWNPADSSYHLLADGGPDNFAYNAMGFRTSIHDLSRFAMAMMNGGEVGGVRVFQSATVDSMFTVQFPRISDEMGLMWFYNTFSNGGYWNHLGGVAQYEACVMIHESRSFGMVYMGNSNGGIPILSTLIAYIVENLDDCIVLEAPGTVPETVSLSNHPNPFNPRTTISYSVTEPGSVRLRVFDLRGRLVRVLVDRTAVAGRHDVEWGGRTDSGRLLPSGTYVVQLETERSATATKVTLVQ